MRKCFAKTALICLVLLTLQVPIQASFTVKGVVLGYDGKPCVQAKAVALTTAGLSQPALQTESATADGRFTISYPEPGFYFLMAAGLGHEPVIVPVLIKENSRGMEVQIKLKPYDYKDKIDDVFIIGDWNKFNTYHPDKMQKQPDGTFTFETKASGKTLRYQVSGIMPFPRFINGTQSDAFEFDGEGDFRSVLNVTPGPVTIRFDPTKLVRLKGEGLPEVKWISGPDMLSEMWRIQEVAVEGQTHIFSGTEGIDWQNATPGSVHIDISEFIHKIDTLISKTSYPDVRDFGRFQKALLYASIPLGGREEVLEILKGVPADSVYWSLMPTLLFAFPENTAFLEEIAEKNSDHQVRGRAYTVLFLQAQKTHDKEKAGEYYEKLKDYKDIREVEYYLAMFNPDRRIKVGMKIPDFKITSLDTGKELTRASFAGKYLLIDFWATWCRPCVMEMPTLDAAWKKYSGDSFRILSVSLDQSVEKVKQFRKDKWKMPWLHGFAKDGFANPMCKDFEVVGIPKPIFVGPNGTILAMEKELRGPNLEKTLAKYLKPNQTDKTQK